MDIIHSAHLDKRIVNWVTKYEKISFSILVLITEGKVSYQINDQFYTAETGDLIFIPFDSYRSGTNYNSTLHTKFSILLNPVVSHLSSNFFMSEQKFLKFKLHNYQPILRKFEQLYDEYLNQDHYYHLMSESILNEIIILISRELEKPEVTPMKMQYVETIRAYIKKNHQKKIEIEHLSQLIKRTPNYTISLFREVVGCSPIVYTHQLRLIEAGNLLINSDMSITDITLYLGYYDTSYFNRIFKKYTSMTPTEFKLKGKPLLLTDFKK